MPVSVRLTVILVGLVLAVPAGAADDPVFVIEFADGTITPQMLEVPAGRPFKLELRNTGASPVEFESLELRKEKVLGPGVTSFIVIRRLAPGEYRFFDDFHLGAEPALLIAREGVSP